MGDRIDESRFSVKVRFRVRRLAAALVCGSSRAFPAALDLIADAEEAARTFDAGGTGNMMVIG